MPLFLPLSSLSLALLFASSHGCSVDDYRYEYTECDSGGQRWRVAVPAPGAHCDVLPQPQRAINCSFSCHAGHYLDISSQTCRPCPAGRYSLGGGIRFEEFVTLPSGFSIENFDEKSDFFSSSQSPSSTSSCPPETGWLLRNAELIYVPSPCVSRLSFAANLVRPGYVDFSYRLPKNNRALSMSVDIRNQQCQSYREMIQSMVAGRAKDEREEANGDWRRRKLEMKSGANVISWTVSNSAVGQSTVEPIRMSRIDVIGLAFTRECSLCEAGTFSKQGSAECSPCRAGYFSPRGSPECGRCPESQYSGHHSETCIDRPPCQQKDFYAVTEPCNSKGKTKTTYKMVQPAVCRTDLPGAAKLPPSGPERDCPKCSPGMGKDNQGLCKFCEKEHFSNGNDCRRCPVDTIPIYGYTYSQWDAMPSTIRTRCEYISEDVLPECNISSAWLPSGYALVSAPSLERGIALEAIIEVPEGFHDPLAPLGRSLISDVPIAHFTVVFETSCRDSSCVIYIIEDASADTHQSSAIRFLAVFNGTQPRRVWSHAVTKPSPTRFTIAFLRSGASSGDDSITDEARILSINITNVGHRGGKQGGGAAECVPCPRGGGGACVPCPPGSFMHPVDHTCSKCPPNHIINTTLGGAVGAASCVPCGENLHSKDGVKCSTDGLFSVNGSHGPLSYDLRPWLNSQWKVEGVKVFTREGASYFHLFNLTIFGAPVRCEEKFNVEPLLGFDQREAVEGSACRLTALPMAGRNVSSLSYVSPTLLGKQLGAVTTNRSYNGWTLTDQLLEYDSSANASLPLDVHFWFDAVGAGQSEACPRGYSLAVTARCAPSFKDTRLRLPRSCPDGTCDGCLFNVLVEGAQACPTCGSGDYQLIRGECVNGHQTLHYIPSKHCVLTGAAAASRTEACSVFTAREKVLLGLVFVVLVALTATLVVVFRRNRRLEYKYTRLVESQTGELPAAETCGLEEDEDEEDRVTFSKGRRQFFSRGGREKADFVPLNNDD